MNQAFTLDEGPGELDVDFAVIVKMREFLTGMTQRRESIVTPRQRPMLHAELRQAPYQLITQLCGAQSRSGLNL